MLHNLRSYINICFLQGAVLSSSCHFSVYQYMLSQGAVSHTCVLLEVWIILLDVTCLMEKQCIGSSNDEWYKFFRGLFWSRSSVGKAVMLFSSVFNIVSSSTVRIIIVIIFFLWIVKSLIPINEELNSFKTEHGVLKTLIKPLLLYSCMIVCECIASGLLL